LGGLWRTTLGGEVFWGETWRTFSELEEENVRGFFLRRGRDGPEETSWWSEVLRRTLGPRRGAEVPGGGGSSGGRVRAQGTRARACGGGAGRAARAGGLPPGRGLRGARGHREEGSDQTGRAGAGSGGRRRLGRVAAGVRDPARAAGAGRAGRWAGKRSGSCRPRRPPSPAQLSLAARPRGREGIRGIRFV
jgi:hypothetical protein